MHGKTGQLRIISAVFCIAAVTVLTVTSMPPARKHIIAKDDCAAIAVQDSGTGISPGECTIVKESQLDEVYYKIVFSSDDILYTYYVHAETGEILNKTSE